MRYFIEFSYLGTDFMGFQIQPNAKTVEGELENAMSKLLRQSIDINGSSRTDTGVHAFQQFAHFDIENPIDTSQLAYTLNKILPKSIFIKRIFEVSDNIHARFDAISRKYEYRILQQKNPFLQNQGYLFPSGLDLDLMNSAGEILMQNTDFQCFSKVNTQVNHFRCDIMEAFWKESENQLIFTIKADRFLRGMVRAIVGTMIEVGMMRTSLEKFESILKSKNRSEAGRAVPPQGLFLKEVNYPIGIFEVNP